MTPEYTNDFEIDSVTNIAIPDNVTSYAIPLTINDDTEIEPTETFILVLNHTDGGGVSRKETNVTILDNDEQAASSGEFKYSKY